MDWDEPKARKITTIALGEDLSTLSVVELKDRVARLEAEAERTKTAMAAKQRHSAAADELFGKREG